MNDFAAVVLAGILPDRKDRLLVARQGLEVDHFTSTTERRMWALLEKYYDTAGDVLPQKYLEFLLDRRGVEPTARLAYEQSYIQSAETPCSDSEFRFAIESLKDLRGDQMAGEALATGMAIMQSPTEIKDERGVARTYSGWEDAIEWTSGEFARAARMTNIQDAPEGDIRVESDAFLREYAKRKEGEGPGSVRTGLAYIDDVTSGLQNGELVMVCGYTGSGKSQLVTQIAWNIAVEQGKNVFFATSETIRSQTARRLHARHSRLPQFGVPKGLNTADIKNATLGIEGERVYGEVLADLAHNPAYGRIYIAQIPRGATLSYVEALLSRQQQEWDVDVVIIDYLALLKPDARRDQRWEEFSEMIKDAKSMAVGHNHGVGVPVISPWAMSRSAFATAKKTGEYELDSLSDTSEAEKSADLIVTLLHLPNGGNEVKVQILKNRDGEKPLPDTLQTDFRNSFLDQRHVSGVEASLSGADDSRLVADFDDLDSMLG